MSDQIIQRLVAEIEDLKRKVEQLSTVEEARFTELQAPLTSTSWDGDSFSTTAKTKIDLSAVFGVPAGIKGVVMTIVVRDTQSATGDYWIILSPNDTAGQGVAVDCNAKNDIVHRAQRTITCDANGDIYYQINASGAGTFDAWLEIWGYYQ